MRRLVSLLVALFCAVSLAACSSTIPRPGPGVDDASACNEVPLAPLLPSTGSDVASASGGQRASNQPTQTDPGVRGTNTTWNRGSGPNTNSPTTTETRSQAGAPSVNQGLILPTEATVGGGGSPAVTQAAENVRMLRTRLDRALETQAPNTDAIAKMLSDAQSALASAEAGSRPVVNYHLEHSVNSQTVANGSRSGGDGASETSATRRTLPAAPGAPEVVDPPPPAMDGN